MAKKKLITTGLTIEKAIQKGLKKIGLPQSQAIIHILQGEESGLFKKTDAAISIIYDEDESHQALIEQVKDDLSTQKALLWEEGQVKLKMCPLFFDETIFKTDEERFQFLMRWLDDNKVTPVKEETIQAIARNPQSQSNYTTIRTLDVHPLNDENGSIYLRVSEDKMLAEAVLFFEGEITEEAIYKVLKENEVTRGVLRHTLQKVLNTHYKGVFPIAKGKKSTPYLSGQFEIFFQEDEHLEFAQMMESLTIDTRNVKDLNVVDRNELLMKIGNPVEGEDGYQVDGEVIPKEIETRELKLGRNVFSSDNGKEVYAGQAGHIIWRPDECFIDIEDVYVVEGNVDFSEGNITDFSGKIVITGDVRPKFSVIADGDIEIHGSVEDAIVESKNGSVFIQGIVVNKAEGHVKAAEDIVVAIATNADLRAKNIRIEKEAMNCTLRASEQIILDGNPGVLVGGMARAKKLIRARTIGSASWIQTKIHVGDVQQLQKLKRTLTQKLNKQELDLKGTAESINMLKLREKTHGLSEPQTRQLKEYETHMKELEEDIATDQEEEQRLLTEISERKDSKLEVLDTLYPKVDLYIFKGYLLPHEKQTHSGFCWRDGLVVPFTI